MHNRFMFNKRILTRSGWLFPGLGIKRWLLLLAFGAVLFGIGLASLHLVISQQDKMPGWMFDIITFQYLPSSFRFLVPLLIGSALMLISLYKLGRNLVAPFKQPGVKVADSLYTYKRKRKGLKIAAIGGGTGMPNLLSGMSQFTSNITAIVTVADDGGSSGRIRRELGLLPPGDFRNNIASLAQDEALMTQLFQYRFGNQSGQSSETNSSAELEGHAFGNLLLAALAGVTGSFDQALVAAGRVLAIQGHVFPSTLTSVILEAIIEYPGTGEPEIVRGESAITKATGRIERVSLDPSDAPAYPPAVQAILKADVVVIGPGSLYTSILPNLLIPDIALALVQTSALRIYICNLATQPGETDNYTVANHVEAIRRHVCMQVPKGSTCLDVILANSNLAIPPGTGGGNTVFVSPDTVEDISMVMSDVVDEERPWRHDRNKIAKAVLAIAREHAR